jgi:hypothetical protein
VVDLWERSGTFSATVIESIKTKYFPLLETKADQPASTPSSSTAQMTGKGQLNMDHFIWISMKIVATGADRLFLVTSLFSVLVALKKKILLAIRNN